MLTGIVPAMITPVNDNGVNLEVLEAYTDWLVGQGVHGLFPLGTTGEGLLFTPAEWKEAVRVVIRTVHGRVPVVIQCGGISLPDTTWRIETAVEAGADGVALMAPYLYAHKAPDVEAYYDKVLETWAKIPAYLYNIPKYTHFDISAEMYARLLGNHSNLLGIKDSSGSIDTLKTFVDAAPEKAVLSGSDATVEEAFHAGARGIVSGVAAAIPDVAVRAWNGLQDGESAGAETVKQIRASFHLSSTIQAARAVLDAKGFAMGHSVPPLPSMSEAARTELYQSLARIGIDCGPDTESTIGGRA